MSSVSKSPRPIKRYDTAVSAFDMLNSALIASIMLIGFLVMVLFMIWLTTAFDFSSKKAVILEVSLEDPGEDKPEGYDDDVLEPGVEEFPEVETPQLMDALEAVTDAVSSVKANLEKRDGDAAQMGRGRGVGSKDGGGNGGSGGIPDYKRWQIEYESKNKQVYAEQIDYLGVIVGAVSVDDPDIMLVTNISKGGQASVSDRTKMSKVVRFEHKKPRMRRWDRTFCAQAGVEMTGRITCQFYPDEVRRRLRMIEQTYLNQNTDKKLQDVRKTYFKVVRSGNGYDFQITDMLFLN